MCQNPFFTMLILRQVLPRVFLHLKQSPFSFLKYLSIKYQFLFKELDVYFRQFKTFNIFNGEVLAAEAVFMSFTIDNLILKLL